MTTHQLRSPRFIINGLCAVITVFVATHVSAGTLEDDFRDPPVAARPYVWWHWLGPNFSKDGITKDLEAMKAAGIGGATIFNISSSVMESHAPTENNPWPDQTYRSPKYWDALKHAAVEADRLGLEIGLHNTVGYSTTGGPWIDEPRSMQRLVWSSVKVTGGALAVTNLPAPKVEADEGWGKAGRKISFFRDVAVLAVPADRTNLAVAEVLDLTRQFSPAGQLRWNAPAGNWTVYRFAHASTGRPPHPVPDDVLGKTLEADKMSLEQTEFHWETVISPLQQHLGPLFGKSFRHFLIDSYEAGYQNWTPDFRAQFQRRKGYDPLPWLVTLGAPVNNGKGQTQRIVGDARQTARFEADYRDVIATLYYENGWQPAVKRIHAAGAQLQFEPYGGPFDTVAGAALADLPMIEFWTGRDVSVNQNVVGGGRAAGRRVIGAEAFTGGPGQSKWTETPGPLKRSADGAFVGGVNRLVLHHWVHQPFDDRYQPGFGMGWWGTHFNRHQTWFEPGKAFFAYLGRVQALLQRGETPVDHVSVGSPHGGGDAIAPRALVDVEVKDGLIRLPSGRQYRFLHVPHDGALLPETVAQIDRLLNAGATVVAPKPNRSPSLAGYPQCDEQVQQAATRLWGDGREPTRKVGQGTLFTKGDITAARQALGLAEPFKITTPGADKVRILSRAEGQARWFFVANIQDAPASFTVSFAGTGMQPELWDAELGTLAPAPMWRMNNGRCEVDLALGPVKSVFVMFRQPVAAGTDPLVAVDAPAGWSVVADVAGQARIQSAVPVSGTLKFASGKTRAFQLKAAAALPVNGPWQVALKPALGKPFQLALDSLTSLSTHTNPEVKYFSGTATYKTTVSIAAGPLAEGRRFILDLGKVADLATVTVNGKPQGAWWHPPFARDITGALQPGENTLEIAVVNTWHNLLVGDEQQPADFEWGADRGANGHMMKGYPEWFVKNQPRPSAGRKGFVVWYYHRKDTPLLPAGLLGPVQLRLEAEADLNPQGDKRPRP